MNHAWPSLSLTQDIDAWCCFLGYVNKLFSDPADAITWITQATRHENRVIRFKAFSVLSSVSRYYPEAIVPIIKGLEDEDCGIREWAHRLLNMAPSSAFINPIIVESLINVLKHDNEEVRCYALEELIKVGPYLSTVLDDLALALRDPDEKVRFSALNTLCDIGPSGKKLLPMLVKSLKEETFYGARLRAALAIGSMGAEALLIVPDLINALRNDPDDTVQFHIAQVLTKIDPSSNVAISTLVYNIQKYGKDIACSAALALKRLGWLAIDTVPVIIETLKLEDDDDRRSVLIDVVRSIFDRASEDLSGTDPPHIM